MDLRQLGLKLVPMCGEVLKSRVLRNRVVIKDLLRLRQLDGTFSLFVGGVCDKHGGCYPEAAGKKEIALSPIAIEIVRRIDTFFAIERTINGQSADHRKAVRQA